MLGTLMLGGCSSMRWRFYSGPGGADTFRNELDALGRDARAAVLEAMKRRQGDAQLPYEDEQITTELRAVRVFFDGCTYRVLYARVGAHKHVLLALHVMSKKQRKLPLQARRLAESRLRSWVSRGDG